MRRICLQCTFDFVTSGSTLHWQNVFIHSYTNRKDLPWVTKRYNVSTGEKYRHRHRGNFKIFSLTLKKGISTSLICVLFKKLEGKIMFPLHYRCSNPKAVKLFVVIFLLEDFFRIPRLHWTIITKQVIFCVSNTNLFIV